MPTAKVTKNVSAATGGGNVLCSTLISIKTKAWLYSFHLHLVIHQTFFSLCFFPFYLSSFPLKLYKVISSVQITA